MSHKEKIYGLEKRVKLLNKALELACKNIDYIVTKDGIISSGLYNENVDEIKKYLIQQAKQDCQYNDIVKSEIQGDE